MPRTLTFDVRFTLNEELAQGIERAPVLRFFLTNALSTTCVTYNCNGMLGREQRAKLVFELNTRQLNSASSVQQVCAFLAQCMLNIDCYNETHTKIDEWVRKLAASADLALGEVLLAIGKRKQSYQLPLRLDTAPPDVADKGSLVLCVDAVRIDETPIGAMTERVQIERVQAVMNQMKSLREKAQANMENYIHASHRLFAATDPSWEATRNIGFYIWQIREGTLPAMMYTLHRAPEVIEAEYFENALRLVLAAEGLQADELLARELHDPLLASVMVQICSMYTRYAYYSSDECYARCGDQSTGAPLKRIDLEQMTLVEQTDADDCEGDSYKIMRDSFYLKRLASDTCSPLLARLIKVRQHYYALMCLGGVASAEIGGDFGSLSQVDEIGAHMYTVFIPRAMFVTLIKRGNRAEQVLLDLNLDEQLVLTESERFVTLVAEGTGVLAPLPIEVPEVKRLVLPVVPASINTDDGVVSQARRVLFGGDTIRRRRVMSVVNNGMDHGAALPEHVSPNNAALCNNSLFVTDLMQDTFPIAFRGTRKWFSYRAKGDDSHFYRTATALISPELLHEGYGVGAFAVMRRSDNDKRQRVGCTFREMVTNDAHISLWPEVAAERDELAAAQLLMENLAPVPPVCGPNTERPYWDNTRELFCDATRKKIETSLDRLAAAAREHAFFVALRNYYSSKNSACAMLGGAVLELDDFVQAFNNSSTVCTMRAKLGRGQAAVVDATTLCTAYNAMFTRKGGSSLPVVITFFLNYQQAQRTERMNAILEAIDSTAVIREDSVQNSGRKDLQVQVDIVAVRYAHEPVTPYVGGYRVQFAIQLSYNV